MLFHKMKKTQRHKTQKWMLKTIQLLSENLYFLNCWLCLILNQLILISQLRNDSEHQRKMADPI